MKGLAIGFGVFFTISLFLVLWGVNLSNKERMLRNRATAVQESNEAFFGKMWEVLRDQAGVSEEYRESFKEIYIPLIEGRYSQGDGSLMKWVVEQNPTFDTSLYQQLMSSIEGQREAFFLEQQKLIDIDRQHKDMRIIFPNSIVIGKRPDFNIVIVKPMVAINTFETGVSPDESPVNFGRNR